MCVCVTSCYLLIEQINSLNDLIETNKHSMVGKGNNEFSKVYTGLEMVAQLKNCNIGPDEFPTLKVQAHRMVTKIECSSPVVAICFTHIIYNLVHFGISIISSYMQEPQIH